MRRKSRVGPCFYNWRGARTSILAVGLLALLIAAVASAQQMPSAMSNAGPMAPGASQTQITPAQARELIGPASEPGSGDSAAESVEAESAAAQPQPSVVPPGQGDLSPVELLLSGRMPTDVSTDLRQFGYDIFNRPASTFAPVSGVPVGPNYIIGPGDSFVVTLWGRVDAQFTLQVDRNGQVVLPEVGALKVWGMRFTELEDYLQRELSRKYADFRMSVVMDRLRSITVYVVGEARTPGSYTVSSLSTVISGLFAAGGPSRNGTLRNITLRRTGVDPIQIDLYDFLLGGDKSGDERLQDGDTIFIPLIGPVVAVAGNVRRPAIYEMSEAMTLREVIDLAGGVTSAGWLQRVQVSRIENHERRIVVDFDLSAQAGDAEQDRSLKTTILDGDVIKVFAVSPAEQNVVHLAGHVARPGKYEFKEGMRLRDLLPSYEALLPQVSLEYGQIERLVAPDFHQIVVPFEPGKLLAGDEAQNLELARYDTVRLFRWDEKISSSVRIAGMVFEPNSYRLVPEMRVADLVDRAGGLRKNAYLRTAEVTRRHISQDGMTTEKIEVDLAAALAGDPRENILLRDYDHLVVRPVPDLEFDRTAEITGQVRFPGVYPIRRGEKLSSLIERAGGFTERAYLRGTVFTRESAREIQRRRLDEMIRQVEEAVLATTEQTLSGAVDAETVRGQEASLQAKQQLLAKLQAAQITGRVVIRAMPLEEFRDSRFDLELEDGDTLTVPERPSTVHVVGEVFNQTSLLYEEGGTVNHYLNKVGGLTRDADRRHLSVIKADGSVISRQQSNVGQGIFWDNQFNRWLFGGFNNMPLEPGDTIVAPRRMDRHLWIRYTKDITQIVFQIAVAAGVVFAI